MLTRFRDYTPVKHFALIGAGASLGLLAWTNGLAGLFLLVWLPFLYGATKNRWQACSLMTSYILATSWPLPAGAAQYFGINPISAAPLWALGTLVFTTAYTALWHHTPARKAAGFVVCMIILAVPPLGNYAWTSPLTIAGPLFPGSGWIGLATTVILMAVVTRYRPLGFILCSSITLLIAFTPSDFGQSKIPKWAGIDSKLPIHVARTDYKSAYLVQSEFRRIARQKSEPIILLPESAAGFETGLSRSLWKTTADATNKTFYAGSELKHEQGQDNTIARISPTAYETVYRQRVPIPFTMHRPWDKTSTHSHKSAQIFTEPSTGERVGFLICYEQILIWPFIQTATQNPNIILAPANLWWADNTPLARMQSTSVSAWAILFGIPLITAYNT